MSTKKRRNKTQTVKMILCVLLVLLTAFGCYTAAFGIGSMKPLKKAEKYGLDINGGAYVVMQADTKAKGDKLNSLMNQTKTVMEQRVNAMGISEANVTVEGKDKIRVELPGVKNADQAIKQIGRTAQLNFYLANGQKVMDGKGIKDASSTADSENGGYKIVLKFTKSGEKAFESATAQAASGNIVSTTKNVDNKAIVIKLDDEIISAPVVHSAIYGNSCEITSGNGGFSKEEATETAQLIKGGALPVSLHQAHASYQSASIGANALNKSIVAGFIGIGIVFLIMLFAYGWLGILADLALLLYILLDLYAFKFIGVVLTLPGIAGIILAIGMAVDANVIIFTRIREEIKNGRSTRTAVHEGFHRALSSILDGQITTLIAAVVLYTAGATAVKGFALTLMIGVILSLFTAVVITQLYVTTITGFPRFCTNKFFGMNEDGTSKRNFAPHLHFIENRKKFYACSLAFILLGCGFAVFHGFNSGIDFTGGTMMQMHTGKANIKTIEGAAKHYGLRDASVVYGNKAHTSVIIKTKDVVKNSEKDQLRASIEKQVGHKVKVTSYENFGPSAGKETKQNAVKSTLLACLFMLIYIRFRFKNWKYGIASIAGLGHDVLVTIAVYAIFGITVNSPFIAGILTVVGYSINDTIIIFDRIREEHAINSGKDTADLINKAINSMLSRSLLTSLTTIGAIIPLFIMVSSELREFTLPLLVGISVGTYSSICLCSPLLYEFVTHGKNKEASHRKYKRTPKKNNEHRFENDPEKGVVQKR
jgi:SecD/SecF fusion protein